MNKLLCICIFLLFRGMASAETLTGKVYDKQTNAPACNANVYLEGTSYLAITDGNGNFTLPVKKQVNTKLIISHVGYETQIFAKPFEHLPEQIYLTEQVNQLPDLTVVCKTNDRYKRSQKMDIFRKQFIGKLSARGACRIKNEDDIELIYDSEKMVLSASCKHPILIENNYLGYELQYDLIRFDLYLSDNSLREEAVRSVYYVGFPRFTDVNSQSTRIRKRRKSIYEYAASNFFRQLSENQLPQSPFTLYKNKSEEDAAACFEITDTPTHKIISLKSSVYGQDDYRHFAEPVVGQVEVLYGNAKQSKITFFTDQFTVDNYGNVTPIGKIFVTGFMGDQRVGDLLPLEYEPEKIDR